LHYASSQTTGSGFQTLNLFFCKVSHVNDLLKFSKTLSTPDCFLQL
jgi:hypothetical protein